jgi:sterol desaturase/sphingolipid hydroxylase (fatty acid hydroxylase superfamily)
MRDALLTHEQLTRLVAFCSVFAVMAIWEFVGPRRAQTLGRSWRWPNNLGVVVADTLLVRILFPTTAVGLALVANAHGLGLFNVVQLPTWIAVLASVILLDLAIYFQHVLFHAVPVLWRLHRMHHADLDVDVTTGFLMATGALGRAKAPA